MPLSWTEIRARAIAFSRDWTTRELPPKGAEKAEAQTFWNEFFEVFGKKRRHVAAFETPVRNLEGNLGRIDLLWPGTLLAEHKSPGENLGKAEAQGMAYIRGLQDEGRDKDAPRYLVVCDFRRMALYDLEPEQDPDLPLFKRIPPTLEFSLEELPKFVHAFGFMAGFRTYRVKEEDPANIEAAELLAELHDVLEMGGYPATELDRFLVRILFCLFAEDTSIFEPNTFQDFLLNRTAEDGSDLGPRLEQFFRILDTDVPDRQKGLDDDLAALKYVNGRLFADRLDFAQFNRDMRNHLIACTRFNWSKISPAIFGSLFQAIMQPKDRRQIGAHYTSERDILKVVHSLFLDDLTTEFAQIKADRSGRRKGRLEEFQDKLAAIHLLDPACGCGNFLIIAYRELRTLEIETLLELHRDELGQTQTELSLDVNKLAKVNVDQLYGIEIEEWPSRIAEVAVWLMDHLMNQQLSTAFGQLYYRLPLRKSATIVCANALRIDWNSVLRASDCTYVLGNPPFVGKKEQNAGQKQDMDVVWEKVQGAGVLDYVTSWYRLAAAYIQNTTIKVAFVSTNSISQGEQVSVLWNYLLSHFRIKILFAHRTFAWQSEARGKAHVHCVIIGFGVEDALSKPLYDYERDPSHPAVSTARNISPYLIEGSDIVVTKRMRPLANVPEMDFGSKAADFSHLTLSVEERAALLVKYPFAKDWVRPLLGSEEFIKGTQRFCLWLKNVPASEIRKCPIVLDRIEQCKAARLKSIDANTRKWAESPSLFQADRQPNTEYLVFPKVSSERRLYVPLGFMPPNFITNPSILVVPNATKFHLGVLSSMMQMAWMRQTCGRMKSDYQYSNTIVYNNYPWPQEMTGAQKAKVEECAQAVLDARQPFLDAGQTLADLYDPLTMPVSLLKAHQVLDRAVDRCYRKEPFESDQQRVEFLFALYQKLTAPLIPTEKAKRKRG